MRQTGLLLVAVAALLVVASPLTVPVFGPELGSTGAALGLLGLGAVAMAASYLLRGPLAGNRRYGLYAATFWVEAAAGAGAALVLALTGVGSTIAWVAVLALSPLAAAILLAGPATRRVEPETAPRRPAGTPRPCAR